MGRLNLQVALELARAGAEILTVAELAPEAGVRSLGALLCMAGQHPRFSPPGLALGVGELARRKHSLAPWPSPGRHCGEAGQAAGPACALARGRGHNIPDLRCRRRSHGLRLHAVQRNPAGPWLLMVSIRARGHLVCERDVDCSTQRRQRLCRWAIAPAWRRARGRGRGQARRHGRRAVVESFSYRRSGSREKGRNGGPPAASALSGGAVAAVRRTAADHRTGRTAHLHLPMRGADEGRNR